jgi:error-prone DNA polymerase
LRLGLRLVKGLSTAGGAAVAAGREGGRYRGIQHLRERSGIGRKDLEALAAAGALKSLEGHRHKARWAVAGVEEPTALMPTMERFEAMPLLRKPTEGQDIVADYRHLGLSLERHPLTLLRSRLDEHGYVPAARLPGLASGKEVRVAGLVITKQRPGTASGVTFVTLEDETGHVNLIVWKKNADRQRDVLLNARLMGIRGELQIEGRVIHVIVRQMLDHTALLGNLQVTSRDFR